MKEKTSWIKFVRNRSQFRNMQSYHLAKASTMSPTTKVYTDFKIIRLSEQLRSKQIKHDQIKNDQIKHCLHRRILKIIVNRMTIKDKTNAKDSNARIKKMNITSWAKMEPNWKQIRMQWRNLLLNHHHQLPKRKEVKAPTTDPKHLKLSLKRLVMLMRVPSILMGMGDQWADGLEKSMRSSLSVSVQVIFQNLSTNWFSYL